MTVINYINSFIQHLLSKLTSYADEIIGDYQSGFRLGLINKLLMRQAYSAFVR
jgi:hypothetical protein